MQEPLRTVQAGDVVRVVDWPGVGNDRFVVEKVVDVPGSTHPVQVYTHVVEAWPGGKAPNGRTGSFRAFPADRCRKDDPGTRRWGQRP